MNKIIIAHRGMSSLAPENTLSAFKLCKEFENMLSKNIESSDVYKINNSNEKKLKINLLSDQEGYTDYYYSQ